VLDIKLFRESPQVIRNALQKRQMDDAIVDEILALDAKRREIIQIAENLKAERNQVSKEIGRTQNENERNEKIEAMRLVGERIAAADEDCVELNDKLNRLWQSFQIFLVSKPLSAKMNMTM
jgi:seryl-tRNA synthetase